jgi:pimeloyl-ACP methyl ester carboxylesterase
VNLAYDDRGRGDPVLFIAGRGGAGRTWHLHQVPEFLRARQSTTTAEPSLRRAKKSGACESGLPAASIQCSQNGWDAMPTTVGSKSRFSR